MMYPTAQEVCAHLHPSRDPTPCLGEGVVVLCLPSRRADCDSMPGTFRTDARSRDVVARSVEDLVTLTHLHEPSLLHVLSLRFSEDLIYTCSGPILLAVNPFKTLPLYTEVGFSNFSGVANGCWWQWVQLPHAAVIAGYRRMWRNIVALACCKAGAKGTYHPCPLTCMASQIVRTGV
jgi:hypothetical protein